MECSIDMNMQNGREHATWTWHVAWTWTWTCSIDMDMQHGHGHAARILWHGPGQWTSMDAWIPECR
jgi:hypothetical protein